MKNRYRRRAVILSGREQIIRSRKEEYLFLVPEQGTCTIRIKDRTYPCTSSELLLFKPEQEAVLIPAEGRECRMQEIELPGALLKEMSDESLDLEECFSFVPYSVAVVHVEVDTVMVLKNLLNKLTSLEREGYRFGLEYYEKSVFGAFLVELLRACIRQDRYHQTKHRKELIIDDVFVYIRRHLAEDLSLKKLESVFFVSQEHLCRKFKEATGMSIHHFILNARIDLSKRYLNNGVPIREIYLMCGFSSYSNYFKAFRKVCGMTPGEYRNSYRERSVM